MFEYGNLIYNEVRGWLFFTEKDEEDLEEETLIGALNYLGKKGWDVVTYSDNIGYILKIKKNNSKTKR